MTLGHSVTLGVQGQKAQQANVTAEGVALGEQAACRTAAQILQRCVEYHAREARTESERAEASDYKDSIRADVRAWAFRVRMRLALAAAFTSPSPRRKRACLFQRTLAPAVRD